MYNFSETNFSKNNMPIESIYSYILPIERNFPSELIFNFVQSYWWLTIPLVIIYVIAIHLGVKHMQDKPKLQLRGLLFAWNAVLTFQYSIGLYRIIPELMFNLRQGEFYHLACCLCPFGCTKVGHLWLWQFVWLKVPELLDTAFVVARKQPLFFLHWYHHCTVLVFTWYMARFMSAPGLIFALVNGIVHAVMYFYYSLKALSIRVPRWVSMGLTVVQLSQMVFGLFTILYVSHMKNIGVPCFVSDTDVTFALVIYVSYFFLFLWYFYQAYIAKDALIMAKFKGRKID